MMPRTTPRYRETRYPSTVNVVVMIMLMSPSLPEHDAESEGTEAHEPSGGAGELAALLRDHSEPVRWWRPSMLTAARELGAWWLFVGFIGMVVVVGWVLLLPLIGWLAMILFKVALLGVAAIIAARSRAIRRTMAARREPFCIHCGYSLGGLADQGTCPECGMVYSFNIVNDFRRDPDWFIRRFEMIRRDVASRSSGATI